jgi:hypothetical protein
VSVAAQKLGNDVDPQDACPDGRCPKKNEWRTGHMDIRLGNVFPNYAVLSFV